MAEHWCKEHQTVWFKKGKMRGFAHPILDEDGKATGEWCNEPEGVEKAPESQGTKHEAAPALLNQEPQMTKDDWAEKDKITRKSIERQKSLELAVKVVEISGVKTEITEKVITIAKRFEAYLEGKEVQKTHLVEAAKKMGAKEIKSEEVS